MWLIGTNLNWRILRGRRIAHHRVEPEHTSGSPVPPLRPTQSHQPPGHGDWFPFGDCFAGSGSDANPAGRGFVYF